MTEKTLRTWTEFAGGNRVAVTEGDPGEWWELEVVPEGGYRNPERNLRFNRHTAAAIIRVLVTALDTLPPQKPPQQMKWVNS